MRSAFDSFVSFFKEAFVVFWIILYFILALVLFVGVGIGGGFILNIYVAQVLISAGIGWWAILTIPVMLFIGVIAGFGAFKMLDNER